MFKPGAKARYIVVLKAGNWRRMPMKLLRWRGKMPSTKQYNLVPNDEFDTRIPLHPEEAFTYGIAFKAKFIGSMEVPRPTSRVEIVAAMRRVRYEFKAKGAKKSKVTFDVSTDGVRVTARKKKTKSKKKDAMLLGSDSNTGAEIMHHPIYRIFYVSHDSSDLKIFSYIARDGATNAFKCNVFKSNKKSQAMRIVRTVGQAFEVCHKQQNAGTPEPPAASASSVLDDAASAPAADTATEIHTYKSTAWSGGAPSECQGAETPLPPPPAEPPALPLHIDLLPPPPRKDGRRSPHQRSPVTPTITVEELAECLSQVEDVSVEAEGAPLSAQHHVQLLRERLQQQSQHTRAAVAQLLLLRDQLAAEQAARCEAQARTHQLLVHNKQLLEHIAALVSHLQDRERGSTKPISAQQLTLLPQLSSSAKIDRWFSMLPQTPALSRPESGFVSGVDDAAEAATLAEARDLLRTLGAKKKRRLLRLRFTKRKTLANKHTLLQ